MDYDSNLHQSINLAIIRGDFPWLIKFFSSKKGQLLPYDLVRIYVDMCQGPSDFAKLTRECGLKEILEKILDADD